MRNFIDKKQVKQAETDAKLYIKALENVAKQQDRNGDNYFTLMCMLEFHKKYLDLLRALNVAFPALVGDKDFNHGNIARKELLSHIIFLETNDRDFKQSLIAVLNNSSPDLGYTSYQSNLLSAANMLIKKDFNFLVLFASVLLGLVISLSIIGAEITSGVGISSLVFGALTAIQAFNLYSSVQLSKKYSTNGLLDIKDDYLLGIENRNPLTKLIDEKILHREQKKPLSVASTFWQFQLYDPGYNSIDSLSSQVDEEYNKLKRN